MISAIGATAVCFATVPCPRSAAAQTQPAEPDAQEIVRLHRQIEEGEREIAELTAAMEDPEGEYPKALEAFKSIDAEIADAKKQLGEAESDGGQAEADRLKQTINELQPKWDAAKERFELALRERRARQMKIASTKEQVRLANQALEGLTGPPKVESPPPKVPTPAPEAKSPPEGEIPSSIPGLPVPGLPAAGGQGEPPSGKPKEESAEVKTAREAADRKKREADEADEKARTVEERMELLRKAVAAEQEGMSTAREQQELARKARSELEAELKQKQADGAEAPKLAEQIAEQGRLMREAESRYREGRERLTKAQLELDALRGEQITAIREAEQKRAEAETASNDLADLENPFAPRNILRWIFERGPKILFIIVVTFLFHRLAILSSRGVARLVMRQMRNDTGRQPAHDRATTLTGVYRYTATLLIYTIGTLALFEAAGVSVTTLLGGAAVFGLAISFGAQSLIKDYFAGFMILAEDQYAVGDIVKVGQSVGVVEKISLRMTVLRNIEGQAHFIPHGQIGEVINLTHGWSRAFFDVGVAYKENVDRVMGVLMELAEELRYDKQFGPLILDEPEMLGVDRFDDSAVVIRFFIKTCPVHQWPVRREMLRRIKNRFDELGIEIPFPHLTVYHHHDAAREPEEVLASKALAVAANGHGAGK